MKRQKLTKVLSFLLSFAMLCSAVTAVTPGAQAAWLGVDENVPQVVMPNVESMYTSELPKAHSVDATEISEYITQDFSREITISSITNANEGLECIDGQAQIDEDQQYIKSIERALEEPQGAMGFDDKRPNEIVSAIVWLQQLPKALSNAFSMQGSPASPSYEAAGAKARAYIKSDSGVSVKHEYSELFSGFALTASVSYIENLANMPGVYAITPDTMMYASYEKDPDYNFVGMKESREAFGIAEIHEAGITGKGVVVGVLDTGIDYNHPDFEGVYKGGWNFITPNADHGVRNRPDNDPMEATYEQWKQSGKDELTSDGKAYYTNHGTHVCGTIAAQATNGASNYKALGIAPEVDLYVARVLGPYGSGATSGIIAAAEDFAADGGNLPRADVINLSLGSDNNTAYDSLAFTLNNMVISGTNVVIAAGNAASVKDRNAEGRELFTLGTPGTAYLPVTVAASQYGGSALNSYDNVTASSGEQNADSICLLVEGYDAENEFVDNAVNGSALKYVEGKGYQTYLAFGANDTNPTLEQLKAIPAGSLDGKVLVVKRGLNFTDFYEQAIRAGAGALIITNSAANGEKYITNMNIGGIKAGGIPLFSAYHSASAKLTKLAEKGEIYLQLGNLTVKEQAKEPAYFSSIGPVKETLGLKPDVIAPGWRIISTQPAFITDPEHNANNYVGAYGSSDGTSMASPHVAGIMALMKQAYPDATPAELKARLMNTAKHDFIDALPSGIPASVLEVGAGFVDPHRALLEENGVYVTVKDNVPGETADSVIEGQTLSSMSFGLVATGEPSKKLPVTVHGTTDFAVSVVYNDGTRYSRNAEENGVKLVTGAAQNGTFDAWVEFSENTAAGAYEGFLVITAGGRGYVVPWFVSYGKAPAIIADPFITSQRPVISTLTDVTQRADKNSVCANMYIRYKDGEWPDGKADIVLLNADDMKPVYYYGTVNLADTEPGKVFYAQNFISYMAHKVDARGRITREPEIVKEGAYYIAMADSKTGRYGSGIVFSSATPTLQIAEFTQIEPDAKAFTVSGKIYSAAVELAKNYRFTWDAIEYVHEGKTMAFDQRWNVLSRDISPELNLAIWFPLNPLEETPYICNPDGEFILKFDNDTKFDAGDISDMARKTWDYLFGFYGQGHHSIVGVDAYLDNDRTSFYGNAKSNAVTPRYGVNPDAPIIEPKIENVTVGSVSEDTYVKINVTVTDPYTQLKPEDFTVTATIDGVPPKTSNGYPISAPVFTGNLNGVWSWGFDIARTDKDQLVEVTVTYKDQTKNASFVLKGKKEPEKESMIKTVMLLNGGVFVDLVKAHPGLNEASFTIKFKLDGEPYQVETTFSVMLDKIAQWIFKPITTEKDATLEVTVTFNEDTVTKSITIPGKKEPVPVLESIKLENGKLTAAVANPSGDIKQEDFSVYFEMSGAEFKPADLTYSYGNGTAAWAFKPVEPGDVEQFLHVVVKYKGVSKSASISIPPKVAPLPQLVSLAIENGAVMAKFDIAPPALTADDFTIVFKLDGEPITVKDLEFDYLFGNACWLFSPVTPDKDSTLSVSVTYKDQTRTAECFVKGNAPAAALESISFANGTLKATLQNAPQSVNESDFQLSFTSNGQPYDIGKAAYSYENGTATWTFEPIGRLESKTVVASVTYAGKTLTQSLDIEKWLEATKVSINLGAVTILQRNKTIQLTAISDVENAFTEAPAEITWRTSNSKVITVDANGLLKAVGTGTASVTVTVVTPFRTLEATVIIKVM